MNIQNIPVLLLTGYLGSGKTTLLNRILQNKKGIKFAVIVNDIGEVNIDADLIEKGGVVGQQDDSLMALQNGCICCTLKMDLVKQLQDILAMHRFDYIVIEASGICEPGPIAQTICSIPSLGPEYVKDGYLQLDSIVTVVDALRMRDEFEGGNDLLRQNIDEEDIENLVIQQIEFCNIILLNKASEVSKEELGKVREIIRTIQPKAEIIECDYCDVDLDKLIHTEKFNFDEVATSAAWIQELENGHDDDEDGQHEEGGEVVGERADHGARVAHLPYLVERLLDVADQHIDGIEHEQQTHAEEDAALCVDEVAVDPPHDDIGGLRL
jgi:G3E family GTPase